MVSCRYVARRVGVGFRRVVGERPFAGALRGQVLTPEQELDGVPTGRDVRLATLFVGLDDDVDGDVGVAGGVVDDAGRRVAIDVVDVRLVHRPGVDLALGSVGGVVDRAVVEPERLGRAVVVASGEPRLLGGGEGRVGRVGEEGVDRSLHLGRRCDRGLIVGVDQIGVRGGDGGQVVDRRARRTSGAAFRRGGGVGRGARVRRPPASDESWCPTSPIPCRRRRRTRRAPSRA